MNEKGVNEPAQLQAAVSDIPLSELPKPQPPSAPTFPEGGTRAWLTVAGAYVKSYNSYVLFQISMVIL